MPRTILHADMDAFYAAIEQRDRPELAGRPVIVGGLGPRGVVATASYEARAFGVHSALPTATARARCPQGVFLSTRMEVYTEVSARIAELFAEVTDQIEPLSLDEAFLDVTGSTRLLGDGPTIAAGLRERVRQETRLAVSVGVASNKFVAKVASDHDKPDGLTVVPPGSEAAFLAPLPLRCLWGVGPATQARLEGAGWSTIGDLQSVPVERLCGLLGPASGTHLHALARGHDERPVVVERAPKSIGRETTFAEDITSDAHCEAVLLALAEDVGRRLRHQGLVGGTVHLKLRHPPFDTLTRQAQVRPATQDDLVIHAQALELLAAARPSGRPVRLLGVSVSHLQPAGGERQGDLFGEASPGAPGGDDVGATLDAIRARFGSRAVRRAGSRAPGGGLHGPESR